MILSELLSGIPHKIIQTGESADISSVTIDSRQVVHGTLFVCQRGYTVDGHSYINNAAKAGAVAIMVEDLQQSYPTNVTIIHVQNSRQAIAYVAANFYGHPAKKLRLVGVTGTNGKTTTTYFIEETLRKLGRKTGIIGTIGARVGEIPLDISFATATTPDQLELHAIFAGMVEMGVQEVVMEVSSHALALYKMEGLIFEVGVFTNLTQDHLDFHGTMENYAAAKAQLFAQSKFAVVNNDDQYTPLMLKPHNGTVITYSKNTVSDIQAKNIEYTPESSSFELLDEMFTLNVGGKFNVYNILATIGSVLALSGGMNAANLVKAAEGGLEVLRQAISKLSGVPGRIQSVPNNLGVQIYIDYAHSPDGLTNIIGSVREVTKGRVITLFGCGGDRDTTKRPIMGKIAAQLSDFCIITSDNPRTEDPFLIITHAEKGVKETTTPYEICENRRDAIFAGVKMLQQGDALIIAGKGHEDYQEIGQIKYSFSDYDTAVKAIEKVVTT